MITGIYYDLFTHVFRIAGVQSKQQSYIPKKNPTVITLQGSFFENGFGCYKHFQSIYVLVHRFRNNYTTHLSANLIAQV